MFNDERGVEAEVEGPEAAVEEFLTRLPARGAAARGGGERFRGSARARRRRRASRSSRAPRRGEPLALVSPDVATCDACLAELFDPEDRRHRYPFLNCTDCGPRFTIVRGVPYDRPLTTMAGFEMCAACRAEYEDPLDRRFHAQPNACPDCGPSVSPSLPEISAALIAGQVVAVKGLGGYHLACLASSEEACSALRARKHREDKPFALMVADRSSAARALVELTAGRGGAAARPRAADRDRAPAARTRRWRRRWRPPRPTSA